MPVRLLALIVLVSLVGCATSGDVREPVPPRAVEVRVFDSPREVDRGYERVGRILGSGSDDEPLTEIVDDMRRSALDLDADALVLVRVLRTAGEDRCRWTVDAEAIRWSDA